ncbi:sensor histidine kinase [Spiractinospora alimapuensis]|uniref:sensor histidine kinase n=1 Tax=Spiractinospora alimapuensis TaxID=2820884 RepID=UPI001F421E15|nr:sensor histidine kinase [Spiractinospora alimapuensis]QVQ51255.1 sensor histidine kinase [Spiractinospora alimapuensis]
MAEHVARGWVAVWDRLWRLAVFAGLTLSTVIAFVRPGETVADRLTVLGLASLLAGWHWWMVIQHPQWAERRPIPMIVYFVVLLGVGGVLQELDPVYVVLMFSALPTAFVTLPGGWAYLGVIAAVVVASDVRALVADWPASIDALPFLLVSTGLICAVGAAIRAMESESTQRRRAFEELSETHARLAELADHNAGLQDQLLGRAREAGKLAERARMARELHDTLAQGLAGVVAQLEAAGGILQPGHDARRHVDLARETAREALAESRRAVQALRPAPLDEGTLPDAVEEAVERWRTGRDIPATVTISGDPVRLLPEAEETMLRAVQETLANVARHASATRVGVTLTFMDDVVVLDVRDDGVGFDPDADRGTSSDGSGFGLTAMRHRIARFAGTVEIESTPGKGTAVSVALPAAASPTAEGARG